MKMIAGICLHANKWQRLRGKKYSQSFVLIIPLWRSTEIACPFVVIHVNNPKH